MANEPRKCNEIHAVVVWHGIITGLTQRNLDPGDVKLIVTNLRTRLEQLRRIPVRQMAFNKYCRLIELATLPRGTTADIKIRPPPFSNRRLSKSCRCWKHSRCFSIYENLARKEKYGFGSYLASRRSQAFLNNSWAQSNQWRFIWWS